MLYYSVTAAVLIGVISLLLVFTLKRLQLTAYRIVITAGIGAIAVSLLFPFIYRLVSSSAAASGTSASIIEELSISAVLSLVLMFILSVTASFILPESAFAAFASKFKTNTAGDGDIYTGEQENILEKIADDGNYLKEIFENTMSEKRKESADFGENTTELESNLEKSVDSEENTDKMGIEAFEQYTLQPDRLPDEGMKEELPAAFDNAYDSIFAEDAEAIAAAPLLQLQTEDMTIEDLINEAFRLKQSGDLEGAIDNFVHALDRKPKKKLVFWIVLDICVLYRELDQVELAKDILEAYVDNFGDIMSDEVRIEIENNLQYI